MSAVRGSVVLVVLLGLVGCGNAATRSDALDSLDALAAPDVATTSTVPERPAPRSSARQACDENPELALESYRPSAVAVDDEAGFVAELRRRGRVRVGVDQNTVRFAGRNATSGEIEGFEVDIARRIAERILGPGYPDEALELVPVDTSAKTDRVHDGEVDLTINAVSMTCSRWDDVAFSSEYYTARQQFLVRTDARIDELADLEGRVVCVTKESSSSKILDAWAPDVEQLAVAGRTDCLVALEEGDADAYFGHDSFLRGMLSQDANVEIGPELLPANVTISHYGIAIATEHPDFVRFVNRVLDEVRADGTWTALHERWLEREPLDFGPVAPPQPRYRD